MYGYHAAGMYTGLNKKNPFVIVLQLPVVMTLFAGKLFLVVRRQCTCLGTAT